MRKNHLQTLLVAATLLAGDIAGAKSRSFVIMAPVGNASARVSNPISWPGRPEDVYWRDIEVRPGKGLWHRVTTIQLGKSEALMAGAGDAWSPDGRYFVVFRMAAGETGYGASALHIIDIQTAKDVHFKTQDGLYVDVTNFSGWVLGAPHAIRVVRGRQETFALPAP